jgi:acetyltransferase-like isoleucine patch superfamily enzyme
VEDAVTIGRGTKIWDNVHVRHGATIGDECLIGEKSYIAYDVRIGNRVKINAFVYICYGVDIEDGVMISAGTIFTNDRFPRATTPDLAELRPSEPDEHVPTTRIRQGATIGAGCVMGSGLTVGQFAMIGMGSVVTRDVGDFHLVMGNPARSIGAVCRCGPLIHRFEQSDDPSLTVACQACGRRYRVVGTNVSEE